MMIVKPRIAPPLSPPLLNRCAVPGINCQNILKLKLYWLFYTASMWRELINIFWLKGSSFIALSLCLQTVFQVYFALDMLTNQSDEKPLHRVRTEEEWHRKTFQARKGWSVPVWNRDCPYRVGVGVVVWVHCELKHSRTKALLSCCIQQ